MCVKASLASAAFAYRFRNTGIDNNSTKVIDGDNKIR